MSHLIDVVTVAYNSRPVLERCLTSVPPEHVARLVVVDHGTDGSAELARSLGAVVVEDPTNPGFGAGQNRGAAIGSAPLLLALNPDAAVDPEGLAAGIEFMDVNPTVAAVQGTIVNDRTGSPERSHGIELGPLHLWGRALHLGGLARSDAGRRLLRRVAPLRDHADRAVDQPEDVESLAATAVLVRRAAFEEVGGFDPGYFLYGEDLDLCARLRTAGWRLVALPHRWATHAGGGSAAGWFDRELSWWRGTMRFAALWWSTPRFAAAVGASAVMAGRMAARRPSRWREAWSVVAQGCRTRRRQPLTSPGDR